MSRPEIAEVLGCSLRQVGYLLERLATRLRDEAEEAPVSDLDTLEALRVRPGCLSDLQIVVVKEATR